MTKIRVSVCQEPGCIEDCECLACLEQFHREGETSSLLRAERSEARVTELEREVTAWAAVPGNVPPFPKLK